jgi:hypothetical protein
LKGWLHQQKQLLFVVGAGFILAGPVVSLIYLKSTWPADKAGQVAIVGVVATVAAAYLAFLAAIVALLAFIVADESPVLRVELNDKPLDAGFDLEVAEVLHAGRRISGPPAITIRLVNTSNFSARNPVVRLQVNGALLSAFVVPWRREGDFGDGVFIWEGGANKPIHGGMPYLVDPFGLAGADSWAGGDVTLSVEVVAEGFRLPPRRVAVRVTQA